MHLLRSIFLVIALLAQAWPVMAALGASAKTGCPMSCCAENDLGCACEAKTDAPRLPAPANSPPTMGRDLVPQVAVIVSSESPLPQLMSGIESRAHKLARGDRDDRRAERRLTVLHCAFLI